MFQRFGMFVTSYSLYIAVVCYLWGFQGSEKRIQWNTVY